MQVDLTKGSVMRNIVAFSLPYLLSYFLQTLYGMADLFFAGQFNGKDVISAVAIGSQVMHMLTVMIVGLAMGGAVLIGHAVGEGNAGKASRAAGSMITLFAGIAAVLTVVLLLCVRPIIAVMSTPQSAVEQTRQYLVICFAGIPAVTAYNVIASLYRGTGDAKSPLVFVAVACAINVALDFVLMGPLGMGAAGAALATVIAQAASVALSLVWLSRGRSGLAIRRRHLLPDAPTVRGILSIGLPVAAQDGFIQVSFLVITVIANRRGVEVAAAVGIVEKIIGFLFLVPSTMLSCISAIASQCVGAGDTPRAKKTLFCGMCLAVAFGVVVAVAGQFCSAAVVSLFTDDVQVVGLGTQYLRSYIMDCAIAAVHFAFSGYFCATGLSLVSFVHNALSIVLVRIPGAWLASRLFPGTLFPMGLAAPAGSLLSALICAAVFAVTAAKAKE